MKTNSIANYKYIFGPVPSRRLGTSLGIDLMPHKTCSLNCIYCECGRTTKLTIDEKEYVPVDEVKQELDLYLKHNPAIDYITFSGSGEPTLHSGIGDIISFLKENYPQYKVALLTNGTLFYKENILNRVLKADVIIPSLDAATESVFKLINRPHPLLQLSEIISGLISLRKKFTGSLILEVFIVPGINDGEAELEKIRDAIALIAPDKVQVNTLDRPGTEPNIKPIDKASFDRIAEYLNNAEFISHNTYRHNDTNSTYCDNKDTVLNTIRRRPCTIEDIIRFTGINHHEVESILAELAKSYTLKSTKLARGEFYSVG